MPDLERALREIDKLLRCISETHSIVYCVYLLDIDPRDGG